MNFRNLDVTLVAFEDDGMNSFEIAPLMRQVGFLTYTILDMTWMFGITN